MIAVHLASLVVSSWAGWQTCRPVGYISTPFPEKFATPRQGCLVPDSKAVLQLSRELGAKSMDARAALDGLEEYSHVWLIWAAHLNGHDATQAKVRAPKLRGRKAGVFSTRAPFRPNPLGLSLARLDNVDERSLVLELSGIDLVSGTPILDIKPYLPSYDAPLPEHGPVRTASWTDPPPLHVRFVPEAEAALDRGTHSLSAAQHRRLLQQTLAADPRPHYRWRRALEGDDSAEYDIVVDGWHVRCRFDVDSEMDTEVVTVLQLRRSQQ